MKLRYHSSAAHKPWSTFCEHPGCDLQRLINTQYDQQTHPEAHWRVKGLEQAVNGTKRVQSLKNYSFIPCRLIARGSENHLDTFLCVCTHDEIFVQIHRVKFDTVFAINTTVIQLIHVRPHVRNMELSAMTIVTTVRSTGFLSPKAGDSLPSVLLPLWSFIHSFNKILAHFWRMIQNSGTMGHYLVSFPYLALLYSYHSLCC